MITSAHTDSSAADDVNMSKIIWVGVVSLALFVACAVAAYLILRGDSRRLRQTRGASMPRVVDKTEIGIVDTVHFDEDRRLPEWRAARQKHLASYGWSDRNRILIHIPINKAMDEVIRVAQAASLNANANESPDAGAPAPEAGAPREAGSP
jgi:hypothetical protein